MGGMGRTFGDQAKGNNGPGMHDRKFNNNNRDDPSNLLNVTKPNPYVIIK